MLLLSPLQGPAAERAPVTPNEWHMSDRGLRHLAGHSEEWHFHLTFAQDSSDT